MAINVTTLTANRTRSIFLPASAFAANYGSPSLVSVVTTRLSGFALDGAVDEGIAIAFLMPVDWDGLAPTGYIYWTRIVAGTGNVFWYLITNNFADAITLNSTGETILTSIVAVPTINVLKITSMGSMATITTDGFGYLSIYRNAPDASDTFDSKDAIVLGVRIDYNADS